MIKNFCDPKFYPYFGQLSAVSQTVYRALYAGMIKAEAEIPINFPCTGNDVGAAMNAIFYDHAEMFWITGGSSYHTLNGFVTNIKPNYNSYASNLSAYKYKLDAARNYFLKDMVGKTFSQAEKTVHDRMANEITYVHSSDDQSSYAALVNKRAVCAGYSRGFQYLMTSMEIPCFYVTGDAKGSQDRTWGPHGWNIICLGNEYYNVDMTWDDCYNDSPGNKVAYTYFNCTDSVISSNHRRDDISKFLPKCTATRYSFQNLTGVSPELEAVYQHGVTNRTVVRSKQEMLNMLIPLLKTGKKGTVTISFPVYGKEICNSAGEWFKDAAAAGPQTKYIGWQSSSRTTDFKNGWCKFEFTLTIK